MKLLLPLLIFCALPRQAAFAQHGAGDLAPAGVAPMCRLVEDSARQHDLPAPFFARLIWTESAFQADAVSRAGARGVAQFMPETARERGLADPLDPQVALPKSAEYLAALINQFGNLGLAAAAYNGGPARVERWLDGQGDLPAETHAYVLMITGRRVEDWAAARRQLHTSQRLPAPLAELSCQEQVKNLQSQPRYGPGGVPVGVPPFEVRLSAYLDKVLAEQETTRAQPAPAAQAAIQPAATEEDAWVP